MFRFRLVILRIRARRESRCHAAVVKIQQRFRKRRCNPNWDLIMNLAARKHSMEALQQVPPSGPFRRLLPSPILPRLLPSWFLLPLAPLVRR